MKKRKYEGLLTEDDEKYLYMFDNMTYGQIVEYHMNHPKSINENHSNIPCLDMSIEEMCEKYDLVDMTGFFVSHGVRLPEDL